MLSWITFFNLFFFSLPTLSFCNSHSVTLCLCALRPCVIITGQFVSMLTSHSSWGEWFPPGLGGLTYLTSHIFTMVVSALLWGQRSEFQTSWVITDFTGFSAHPLPARSSNPSHELLFVAPPSLLWFFLDPFWLQVKKLSWAFPPLLSLLLSF